MSIDATIPRLKSMPFFADLEESKLFDFQRLVQFVTFTQGECLMTQGQIADTLFFLDSGLVEIVVRLPGGNEHVISTLGPGSVMGEMALFDEVGTRTATVRALTATSGFIVERRDCQVFLSQSQSVTFTLQQRITLSLCQRLRDLLGMIARVHTANDQATTLPSIAQTAPSGRVQYTTLAPEYRAILPRLPFFQHFHTDELAQVLEHVRVLEAAREQVLFRQGDPGQASYIVVRGAVELVDHAATYALGALGPGRICGQIALIDAAPHEMTAITRSETTLFELLPISFSVFGCVRTRFAAKFQNAILQSLLMLQVKADNHLTRMISQVSIRTQPNR